MPNTTTPFTRYRMPVGFGPAPGPRQKADGTEWTADETGTMRLEFLTISFLGRAGQLERLLPPGFSLRGEPVVSVQLGFFRDLYWLAGRGYGILHPLIPVTYTGKTERIEGNFMPVIWEGLADAIVTGRDELGFPKLAADFPDFRVDLASGRVSGTASWLGFEFFSAELTGLTEVRDAQPPAADPMLTFKYVPRTSPTALAAPTSRTSRLALPLRTGASRGPARTGYPATAAGKARASSRGTGRSSSSCRRPSTSSTAWRASMSWSTAVPRTSRQRSLGT